MLGNSWICHFVVEILIRVSEGMCSIMWEVILVHVVVMKIHAPIVVLRLEVEADIVPVSWHELVDWELLVTPVIRKGHWQVTCLENGHLTLEVLILASIVVLVPVTDTNTGSNNDCAVHASASQS